MTSLCMSYWYLNLTANQLITSVYSRYQSGDDVVPIYSLRSLVTCLVVVEFPVCFVVPHTRREPRTNVI